MLLKITYLLMRWTFGLAVVMFRGDQAKNAELLVLRHENAVLRRNAGRVRYEPADRAWFTALTRFIPRRRRLFVVSTASGRVRRGGSFPCQAGSPPVWEGYRCQG